MMLRACQQGMLALAFGLTCCRSLPAQSQGGDATLSQQSSTPERPITLKETLEKGLRARLPEEFAFIETVSDRVDEGTLSPDLVKTSFNWARKKPRYQVQYFKRALRELAARRGQQI